MNTRFALCFILAFFFCGGYGAKITFNNKCPYTIWPATQTGAQKPQLSNTGFELQTGATVSLDVPSPWEGRFWGRTGCTNNAGKFSCATADCGSDQVACGGKGGATPATLAELHVVGNGGQDFYDISNVDGFNIPMSIAPQGGTGNCVLSNCPTNINTMCLPELQMKGADGNVVGCKSACAAFSQPMYCCTEEFNSPEKCKPTQYSEFFKKQCPQAYSYAYDDKSSLFTCSTGSDYTITFCP